MLYQDTLTGLLHEVPDPQVQGLGEAQMVYDGLGNPLGFSFKRALGKLAAKAAPYVSAVPGPWGLIAAKALPLVSRTLLAPGRPRPPMQVAPPPPPQFMPAQMEPELSPTEVGEVPAYARPGMYPRRQMIRPAVASRWIPAAPAHWSRPTLAVWSGSPPVGITPSMPRGWKRPEVPYTGVKPRRVYMRCAVWRGPGGLVPISPGQRPVATPPGVAPGAPIGPRRPRRRRRR